MYILALFLLPRGAVWEIMTGFALVWMIGAFFYTFPSVLPALTDCTMDERDLAYGVCDPALWWCRWIAAPTAFISFIHLHLFIAMGERLVELMRSLV